MALPVVNTNEPGVKELIQGSVKEIANTIFAAANVSITAAAKAVTPSIPEMIGDITEDLRAGPVNRFSQGLEKLDKLLQNFGGNIKDYSAELAKFVDQREARIDKSEKTIRELRENNVKAEMTNTGEINILSKFQIALKEKDLKIAEEAIAKEKANIVEKTKLVQDEKGNTKDRRQSILKSQNTIIEKEKERTQLLEVLNRTEEEDKRGFFQRLGDGINEYVPDGLSDIGSAFTEGLMAPINAIKDVGKMFGSIIKFGKNLPKLLKGFAAGLFGALMAMLPYLLIVGAVVLAIMGLMKILDYFGIGLDDIINGLISFKDFLFELPGKIADGFKTIFTKLQNFFIDAINGVISLINKIPGIEIEKLDRKELPQDEGTDYSKVEMAPPGADPKDMTAGEQDAAFQSQANILTAGEEQDNAFNVTPQEEDMGFFEKIKNKFKSKPANNEYMPVDTQSQAGSSAIIDNSVKTVNQSNTTQSTGLSSRNDDATIFRTSDVAI